MASFTGRLGHTRSNLRNIVLGGTTGTVYSSAISETVAVTPPPDSAAQHATTTRLVPENVNTPAAFDSTKFALIVSRRVVEFVTPATDIVVSTDVPSTFLSIRPLPVRGVVYDANLNFVGVINQLLNRPVFKSSINGGFQPITLDLPVSTVRLQNGYIVRLYEQGGDGSILYQGVIEDLPDVYDTDVAHKVGLSPMVIFLGSTNYTASWVGVDIAVIVRDIVSSCPYLKFTPTSIQNVTGNGNLLLSQDASFTARTTGNWATGTTTGMLGVRQSIPGTMVYGQATNATFALSLVSTFTSTITGILGSVNATAGDFIPGQSTLTHVGEAGPNGANALVLTALSGVAPLDAKTYPHVAGIAVAAGGVYTALASLRTFTAFGSSWKITLAWIDVNNVVISSVDSATTPVQSTYGQLYVTATAPVGAKTAIIYIAILSPSNTAAYYLTDVSLAPDISQIWTPGIVSGSKGTATLSFSGQSALQALTTCIQAAGPGYYFFVDEVGIVWLTHRNNAAGPTYSLSQGAQFSKRDFSAPIDTLCNFVEVRGGNQLTVLTTTTTTDIPSTADVSAIANSIFNVLPWNYPPGEFVAQIDNEMMVVRCYGDVENAGSGGMSVRIYQRGYGGTAIVAHLTGGALNTVGLQPQNVPITAFYDGTNGAPRRDLIPPATFADCVDYPTLQQIANTLGAWLNRKVITIQLVLPKYGQKIRLNSAFATTVSYWEPAVNSLVESYTGTGIASPNYIVTDVEIDGASQTIMLSDMPFTSQDLQYFIQNMLQISTVSSVGALRGTTPIDPSRLGVGPPPPPMTF